MSLQRRLKRRSALRVWKALGKPGSFKDFWRKQYETPVRIPYYSTSGTASNTSDRRKGLLARIKRFFSRRTR